MKQVFEGSAISWEIRDDTLYISGNGDMTFLRDTENDRLDIPWYYEDFTRVHFEGNITSIGPEAFHTSDLVEVDVPDSVNTIEPLAFCSCRSLERVTFGRHLRSIGGYAFEDCIKLRRVVLGGCVEEIGYSCFEGCTSLVSFVTSPVLRNVGEHAFLGCVSLLRISLSDAVQRVSGNPFADCTSLEEIEVSPFNPLYSSKDGALYNNARSVLVSAACARQGDFTVPDTVVEIGREAFRGCGLRSISIPAKVRSLDVGALRGCPHLEEVRFLSSQPVIVKGEAFKDCPSLRTVSLPDMDVIEFGTFEDCGSLHSIDLPKKLTRINERAFMNSGLISVDIPNGLECIGESAFEGCAGLTRISLGENVASVGNRAFADCTGLAEVEIPESVVEIEDDAFEGCTGIRRAVVRSDIIDPGDIFGPGTEILH